MCVVVFDPHCYDVHAPCGLWIAVLEACPSRGFSIGELCLGNTAKQSLHTECAALFVSMEHTHVGLMLLFAQLGRNRKVAVGRSCAAE